MLSPAAESTLDPVFESGVYGKWTRTTAREAVLITLKADNFEKLKETAIAKGNEKHGWFPGFVLLFTPFYTRVDTEESALQGVVKPLADYIVGHNDQFPVQVAVLAAK